MYLTVNTFSVFIDLIHYNLWATTKLTQNMIYVYSGFGIILCPRFNVYPYWTSIHGGRDLGYLGYYLCAKEINSFSCVSCFILILKQIPVGRIYSQQ